MVTKTLTLTYPEDLTNALHLTSEELAAEIPLMAALKLFELGKLGSGKAAELAGISRLEFLEACGRYRIPIFNPPPDQIEAELRSDLEAAKKAHP